MLVRVWFGISEIRWFDLVIWFGLMNLVILGLCFVVFSGFVVFNGCCWRVVVGWCIASFGDLIWGCGFWDLLVL